MSRLAVDNVKVAFLFSRLLLQPVNRGIVRALNSHLAKGKIYYINEIAKSKIIFINLHAPQMHVILKSPVSEVN